VADVKWRLIPREEGFFDDFIAMATLTLDSARLLQDMLASDRPVLARAAEINAIENQCDTLTQHVVKRLHRTFVTPIDREDILALALALDDVTDAIDDAAGLLQLYHIEVVREGTRDLARIVTAQAEQVLAAVTALRHKQALEAATAEINRLEHDADVIHRRAVETLFANERDPIAVIKWKEIFDDLEAATDRAEDVANVLDSVVVKHA
jgi:predicted phosphate transport protein (TIGR00153 family)